MYGEFDTTVVGNIAEQTDGLMGFPKGHCVLMKFHQRDSVVAAGNIDRRK